MSADEGKSAQRQSIVDPVNPPMAAGLPSADSPLVEQSDSVKIAIHLEQTSARAEADTGINVSAKSETQPESVSGNLPVPRTLGRYNVMKEIGRGGMGAVYLAEDTVLKRKVALKLPQFEPSRAQEMQARFLREAQTAAQLSHPNICQVYDVEVINGQYVMAMEYIEGKTLSEFASAGKQVSERQAVLFVRKVAQAMEVAHQRGLIHRDLKPGNIMLPKPDPVRKVIEPKVMDFGLAKSCEARTTELTRSGMIVGTPCYMSKEQWSGTETTLGPQCDVYSLGVILYELLTEKLPYVVEDRQPATAWFVQLVTKPQIKPSEHKPSLDPALESIVLKAIAKDAEDRYPSMAAFALELEAWLKGKPILGMTQLAMQLSDLPDASILKRESNQFAGEGHAKNPWGLWAGSWVGLGAVAAMLLGATYLFLANSDSKKVTVPIEPPIESKPSLSNGDFSKGLEDWEIEGGPFRTFLFPSGVHGFTTSGPPPDFDLHTSITGRLFQHFYIPEDAQELEFYAHGGKAANLYIALKVDDRIKERTGAYNENKPFKVVWPVSSLRGKLVTLEIVDMNLGREWGFIGAHGFRFLKQNEE